MKNLTSVLPTEIWQNYIFPYLSLEELCRARLVCKAWWDLINCDHLWKNIMTTLRVNEDFVNMDKYNDDVELKNCEWAKICFLYFAKVVPNWHSLKYRVTSCPPSTECVALRLPFMLRTFDPYHVVDVLRLRRGGFVPVMRLPLPDDGRDGCFVPLMTSDWVFVVSKNAYIIIFRLKDDEFLLDKTVCMTEDNKFETCAVEKDLATFVHDVSHSEAFLTCYSADVDTLWIFEEITRILYVFNHVNSILIFKLDVATLGAGHMFTQPTENFVFCFFSDQISAHLLSGQRLWLYKQKQSTISDFCWDKYGCGIIEISRNFGRRALYVTVPKFEVTHLNVVDPLNVTLDETNRLAYCFREFDLTGRIVCASLLSAETLWEVVICPSLASPFVADYIEMNIILDKYLTICGLDGKTLSPGTLSLYSAQNGEFIRSKSFCPNRIVHLSNNFIITRGRYPRGGMRYHYEICSLL